MPQPFLYQVQHFPLHMFSNYASSVSFIFQPTPKTQTRSTWFSLFLSLRLRRMCPLRFILVFLSAVLAGYFAWSSVRSSQETALVSQDSSSSQTSSSSEDERQFNFKRMVADGFWVFVDMASGRYLWRNLKGKKNHEDVKAS